MENLGVLVTGGAGFIGSRVAQLFAARGHRVTSLDDYTTGDPELHKKASAITRVDGSVTNANLVAELVRDSDIVIHAACRGIGASMKYPDLDFAVNAGGTMNVLDAARRIRMTERVVYLSSASVYGAAMRLPTCETDPTSVLSPYSASKLAGEHYCTAFYESYGVPVTILRLSNVYGPGQTTKNPYCGVVGKFMAALRSGETPQVHGDGRQTRDFTYIEDVAEAIWLAAMRYQSLGRTYNVGTGRETTMLELARSVLDITGQAVCAANIRHIPPRDIDLIPRRALHCEQIRRDLQWQPKVQLAEGLRATYKAMCADG